MKTFNRLDFNDTWDTDITKRLFLMLYNKYNPVSKEQAYMDYDNKKRATIQVRNYDLEYVIKTMEEFKYQNGDRHKHAKEQRKEWLRMLKGLR